MTAPPDEPKPAPTASSTPSKAASSPGTVEKGKPVPRAALPTQKPNARALANHRKWKRIEWAWTLIPALLLVMVAGLSVGLLYNLDTGPTAFNSKANWHINVTGSQWTWTFTYTDPYAMDVLKANNVTNYSTTLYVPQNAVVWLNVTSVDVIHDFNVPQLGVRIDAIPGRINHYWFSIPQGAVPWETTYLIQCAEFCGSGHYAMVARIIVLPSSGLIPPA